jgi:hypothetical protein
MGFRKYLLTYDFGKHAEVLHVNVFIWIKACILNINLKFPIPIYAQQLG